jgi:hypothetical protein
LRRVFAARDYTCIEIEINQALPRDRGATASLARAIGRSLNQASN